MIMCTNSSSNPMCTLYCQSLGELRPKGKPEREADIAYGDKSELVAAATTWKEVQQLFKEVEDNADR